MLAPGSRILRRCQAVSDPVCKKRDPANRIAFFQFVYAMAR